MELKLGIITTIICFVIPIVSTGRIIVEDWDEIKKYLANSFIDRRLAKQEIAMTKKTEGIWRQSDGKVLKVAEMSDIHLSNAIKLVVRAWSESGYLGSVSRNTNYRNLTSEANKRGFKITLLIKPVTINGRKEHVDVFIPIPTPRSKIAPSFFPTDWDSRPQE